MELAFDGDSFGVRIGWREVRSVRQSFEMVVRPRVALCIPVAPDGGVLLVRQHRAPIDAVTLEFPAGRQEEGECAEGTARRELLEEAGFSANVLVELGLLLTAPHFSNELVTVYLAKGQVVSPPSPTSGEDLRDVVTMKPSSIRQLIASGMLLDAKTIAAFALALSCGHFLGSMGHASDPAVASIDATEHFSL